jgi:L-fuculose-phosphate aldolase
MNPLLTPPREQITEIIGRIYRRGLTTTSGGNISIRDDEGNVWITPTGVDGGSQEPAVERPVAHSRGPAWENEADQRAAD